MIVEVSGVSAKKTISWAELAVGEALETGVGIYLRTGHTQYMRISDGIVIFYHGHMMGDITGHPKTNFQITIKIV